MSMTMTAAPAVEPVSLAAARAHLRLDGTDDDAYLASLIATSRLQVEAALGIALIDQSWTLTIDAWPDDGIVGLPLRPVSAVGQVNVITGDGAAIEVPAAQYRVDGASVRPRVIADPSAIPEPGRSTDGIEINFIAGFGASPDDVPAPIRHAILLLVAHWYECRDAGPSNGDATRIPDAVSVLLAPYRQVRL